MPKAKPNSSTLMDLEWARVYADRIREELKLIGKTLSDLNAHAMHPHLVKGALLLKAQMKEASQQVGGMRKIASQYESSWMNTIKKALERKYPGFNDGKSTARQKCEKENREEQIALGAPGLGVARPGTGVGTTDLPRGDRIGSRRSAIAG